MKAAIIHMEAIGQAPELRRSHAEYHQCHNCISMGNERVVLMVDGFRGLPTVEAWIKAFTYHENRCCNGWQEEAAPREWSWVQRDAEGVSGRCKTLEQKHHQLWKRDT